MTTWLVEGRGFAHAYHDDDGVSTAACGHRLQGRCDECGHTLRVRDPGKDDLVCADCATFVAAREDVLLGAKLEGEP